MSDLILSLTRRSFLTGSAAMGAIIMLHPFSARAAGNQAHLRIMETTDIHVNVLPYDYYADKPNDTMGLSRTASLIDAIRKEATNSMLIDNGDLLQGNPMGDYIAYEKGMKEGDLHPIMKGMNLLGYECSTLGNHEFNYGLSFLDKVLAGANFPFVCANLIRGTELAANPRDDKLYLKPYLILDKKIKDGAGAEQPIKIGIIGFVPPQIMIWDAKNLDGNVRTRDIVEAAKAWVPQIKEEGADIVIALSHSGIDVKQGDMMENASFFVAGVEGIDAVFTGHQHLVFPGKKDFQELEGVDTRQRHAGRQAGRHGRLLGLAYGADRPPARKRRRQVARRLGDLRGAADLRARRQQEQGDGRGRPEDRRGAEGRSRGDARLCPPAGRQDLGAALFLFRAGRRRPVGADRQPGADLVPQGPAEGRPSTRTCRSCRRRRPSRPAAAAAPDYYTDVPAGDVAIKNVADLYLYPNTVRAVAITGAQVKEWLEMSAGIFNQIEPGKADQKLINLDFPSYNFDVIDGVTYRIDLSQPPKYDPKGAVLNASSNRIVDLHVRRQADRSGSRNSSLRPTTTGPAAAAISRRSTRPRSSSRRPTPTAT